MAEVDLLVTVMGYVAHLDEDELLLLRRLQEAQESRRCPTFGRANVAALACLANQIGQQLDGASTTVDHMTDGARRNSPGMLIEVPHSGRVSL